MSFEQALDHLDALGVDAMKKMRPNMARIEAMCEALDHPERAVPAIHITGTNGKTSTARLVTSLLAATGLSVGTYTSPHLQTVRERIALNGEPLSELDFGDLFVRFKPYLELVEKQLDERLTYFEVLTAMFFLWAADASVDTMVVEVGLGGRWDATNVVPSKVSVITNVGLDHTGLLGMDRETIAKEKSGIIKPASAVVTGERTPGVLAVIEDEAQGSGAAVSRLDREFSVTENRLAVGGRYLSLSTTARDYEGLFVSLHGAHQGVNAAIALEATHRFVNKTLDQELVSAGFAEAASPGRLETVRLEGDDAVPVVLDVAHNPDGMAALVNGLVEEFAFQRAVFVVGILSDKDHKGMLSEIARVPASLIATRPANVRSIELLELEVTAADLGIEFGAIEDVPEAVDAALKSAGPGELVCITGSHYVVGQARTHLLGEP